MTPTLLLTLALLNAAPAEARADRARVPGVDAAWLLADEEARQKLLPRRLLSVSESFLGTPYVHSPLGEGQGVDPDPAIRFDAVDCLTFVEQTLALGLARGPEEVDSLLSRLRYAEQPTYEDRNHLMEAQWIPNNVRKGFLRDVTRQHGGKDTLRAAKVLSARSWSSPSSQALALPEDRQLQGTFELDLIPLAKLRPRARALPEGTILMVVRDDLPGKVTRITHLGFVVKKRGRTYLRHAARSHYRAVVDEDLETFLLRNSKYSKWPVIGVSLFEAQRPADPKLTASSGTEAGPQ